MQSTHQVDMKNIVKCCKHFFGYFNTLETQGVLFTSSVAAANEKQEEFLYWTPFIYGLNVGLSIRSEVSESLRGLKNYARHDNNKKRRWIRRSCKAKNSHSQWIRPIIHSSQISRAEATPVTPEQLIGKPWIIRPKLSKIWRLLSLILNIVIRNSFY